MTACCAVTLFAALRGSAQSIKLQNPSFEGISHEASTPPKWVPCGYLSTPDILPGVWGVTMAANDGKTYVGITTREDNTFEALGQTLSEPMRAGQCYTFVMSLARSETYAGYNRPIRVRIWGGRANGDKAQLLAVSPAIASATWKRNTFYFFPKKEVHFITIEAFYTEGYTAPYRGNILLDNCSSIEPCIRADAGGADKDAGL